MLIKAATCPFNIFALNTNSHCISKLLKDLIMHISSTFPHPTLSRTDDQESKTTVECLEEGNKALSKELVQLEEKRVQLEKQVVKLKENITRTDEQSMEYEARISSLLANKAK